MSGISTNLAGRVRNTRLTNDNVLLPLFEAIANSIQAIEDLSAQEPSFQGKISVSVLRETQTIKDTISRIIGFRIHDNGIGFDEANYQSFLTLDSDYKQTRGGRGIGRLMWLKVFENVQISSQYEVNGVIQKRCFRFSEQNGIEPINIIPEIPDNASGTIVELREFKKGYAYNDDASTLADSILRHNLSYFLNKQCGIDIKIIDGNQKVFVSSLLSDFTNNTMSENFSIDGRKFDIIHIKERHAKTHTIAYCASGRVVTEIKKIGDKLPGCKGRFTDDKGEFTYLAYVTGKYFDDNVASDRTAFDIPKNNVRVCEEKVSMKQIDETVIEKAKGFLSPFLELKVNSGLAIATQFVNTKAPKYKPILRHIERNKFAHLNDLNDESEIELFFHTEYQKVDNDIIKEGQALAKANFEEDGFEEYKSLLETHLRKVSDIHCSDIATYVAHRKTILELLRKSLKIRPDNKYSKEKIIHKLIIPMGKDSTEVSEYQNNLWVIDESLNFHHYLASYMKLSEYPIISTDDESRPDIAVLNVFDVPILCAESENTMMASINIIEFKRPMRNDMTEEENPIDQVLDYVEKIRAGKCCTSPELGARPIPKSDSIPCFCYIIADITEKMEKIAKRRDMIVMHDNRGFFGFHKDLKTYIEIISYDKLCDRAIDRNKAFFEHMHLSDL